MLLIVTNIILSLSAVSSFHAFDIDSYTFSFDYEIRETHALSENWQQLSDLQQQSPSDRARFLLERHHYHTNKNTYSEYQLPKEAYILFVDCTDVTHCSVFKRELINQLSQQMNVIDQQELNKVNNRQLLCDVEVLSGCDTSINTDAAPKFMLPQLVISVAEWRYKNLEYSGYEAHAAMIDQGTLMHVFNYYQPLSTPRRSLKSLATKIVDAHGIANQ